MITIPDLQTSLLDLLHEIESTDIKLIIGGGFGIYLKTGHVQRLNARTLLREWPEPRSTNDLDLFLRPELIIDSEKLKPLAEAIARLVLRIKNNMTIILGLTPTQTLPLQGGGQGGGHQK